MFLAVTKDILIVTDKDFCAGLVVGDPEAGSGIAITRGYLRCLTEVLFDDAPGQIANFGLDRFSRLIEERRPLPYRGPSRKKPPPSPAPELLRKTYGLGSTTRPQKAGAIRVDRFDDEGTIRVGRLETYRPPGELRTRKMGARTVSLAIAGVSLLGAVELEERVGISGFASDGPMLSFENSSCGACGACGACGICAICAAVNYTSGAVAAAAIAALTAVSGEVFGIPGDIRPGPRPDLGRGGRPPGRPGPTPDPSPIAEFERTMGPVTALSKRLLKGAADE